ncbi:MAG TPA: aminotransferase class III-fold pyridoxal phosphate-dependent enzyme [Candidatus Aminicenantes bacterium]|nr:aminotransferase class III-fold pyridoxal phosphate-dependent enzyme [Candidatus Aminicenantes bacterium]
MIDAQGLEALRLLDAYPRRGLTIRSGRGMYLEDDRGRLYLDMMSNYGVSILGHGHPAVVEALERQLRTLAGLHGSFAAEVRARAAGALLDRCGGGLAKVFFTNSGSEANEAALKFAVLATGRKKFIAFRRGFHGKTLGALSATDGGAYRLPFEPLLWEFEFAPFGEAAALEMIDGRTAGVIVEPVQGEGGVRVPPPSFLGGLAKACATAGAVLILDEIQTGMGRTGRFLASSSEVPCPDVITLGKGLAGGVPAGAVLLSGRVARAVPRKIHTSTFGGNPLAAAGVLAVLSVLDDGLLGRVEGLGRELAGRLRTAAAEDAFEIRGRGLMVGAEVGPERDSVLRLLQRERVLAIPAGPGVVRFLPPYILEEGHVEAAVRAFAAALAAVRTSRRLNYS